MNHQGLYHSPTLLNDLIVFVCEDDLWKVPCQGGSASRITAGEGETFDPLLSHEGQALACTSSEEGARELYLLPVEGGETRRLTFMGTTCRPTAWTPEGDIVFSSCGQRPFSSERWLYRISPQGGLPQRLEWGPANDLSFGPEGQMLLGRNTKDPSHWKRYRGGQAGEFWLDPRPSGPDRFASAGQFRRLKTPPGNCSSPCWVGERIYFLSDHEGICNLYSCDVEGEDLRRHSDHCDFYARQLSSDGQRLVYACAGDLYLLDPGEDQPRKLEVFLGGSRSQAKRRFVPISQCGLQSFALSPDGSRLAITARGKAFTLANWEGPVVQHGQAEGVRYQMLAWMGDQRHLLAVASDESPDPYLVFFPLEGGESEALHCDIGTVTYVLPSPCDAGVVFLNHRNQVLWLDPERQLHQIDSSPYGASQSASFSSDGRWLAYDYQETSQIRSIKLCRLADRKTFFATHGVLQDFSPCFDPEGDFLYFVGRRDLKARYDDAEFALGFPASRKLFALALRKDVENPFLPKAKPLESEAVLARKKAEEELTQSFKATEIDLEGLEHRVLAFPLGEGIYQSVMACRKKVLFLQGETEHPGFYTVEIYDFQQQKQIRLVNRWVQNLGGAFDYRTMVYYQDKSLRVLPAEEFRGKDSGNNRASGHIDLARVRISIRPTSEFRQMFREAWRLQRDYFWDSEMNGLEWEEIYQRYLPLVDRATTRHEFGDLLWELLGELGTSHAYVSFGSYRKAPALTQGFLGADWSWDGQGYRCLGLLLGDPWSSQDSSPLLHSGAEVQPGDILLAINGQPLSADVPPGALLVNQGGREVELTFLQGQDSLRRFSVKALNSERRARYRNWVNANRQKVRAATRGRVGYLHVPDMGLEGYAEFHRSFLAEFDYDALIVDVRFNGGGNVSGLLLQKLMRRRLGYTIPRWGSPTPYPHDSPRGPLVAITNEHAGSDGDIFSHAFKQLNLGPLVGRRTWGGVIGIYPQHTLADNTTTTQPEFSFFFDDVGWQLENQGTNPDIEVDITPADYFEGRDRQLEVAIETALELLAQRPPHSPKPTRPMRREPIRLPPREGTT